MSRSGPGFDRRRFNGPEDARPFVPFRPPTVEEEGAAAAAKGKGKAASKGKGRADGRGDGDVRPIYMKMGLVTQANGSCYIETGNLKLICAVYGPKPLPRSAPYSPNATLSVTFKFSPFSLPHTRLAPGPSCESASLSAAIHQALRPSLRLDLLPRSAVEVYVTVLEWDAPGLGSGGESVGVEAAVTGCSAALASAGIEMYGLVIGVGAALWSPAMQGAVSPGRTLLDPTLEEVLPQGPDRTRPEAFVSLAVMPALGTTTNLTLSTTGMRPDSKGKLGWGGFNVDSVDGAVGRCKEVAGMVHGVVVKALEEEEVRRAKDDEAGER